MLGISETRLYTTKQLAEILGLSVYTIKSWRSRHRPKKGPNYVKFNNGSVRYYGKEIIRYLNTSQNPTQKIA